MMAINGRLVDVDEAAGCAVLQVPDVMGERRGQGSVIIAAATGTILEHHEVVAEIGGFDFVDFKISHVNHFWADVFASRRGAKIQ